MRICPATPVAVCRTHPTTGPTPVCRTFPTTGPTPGSPSPLSRTAMPSPVAACHHAGSLHLALGAVVLLFTLNVWHDAYAFSHPAPLPPCPTRAGVPCAPPDQR
ncbi:hypothetical protein SAV14893_044890 [Streptomyces avermitilis]|uniref:Uncharacterized protein n=1 Tax=Streptomyces avermitilis TaxID=33903 RepID=A0A4D4LZA1_STRAX|nr:hypothetical protein SAVMC3_57070 [Streptomyces avermitilis]GDY65096.1 hypothetical protein SAV14893_044890 [Streptomyces avermitilis]GDY74699.1 hypothetical protein SAV31267_041840 [Streptomyces avermitilis]GDY83739.1 hypothetical protein SAVCW2_29380 [Streptomyces avermitilis]